MFFSGNNTHLFETLDDELKEKAEIIAQQLILKEKLQKERAYMIAHALIKKYDEMKGSNLY